jgi:predicted double-glycine peptidase
MLVALAAALSLASLSPAATIDVPFVPQTDALCGGAAAAMVFRYWGDRSADAQQFATLVERHAGGVAGISTGALDNAVRARGWRAERLDASDANAAAAALRLRIESRQPVIVLLAARRDRYHYVVATGWSDEDVVVHDPSWGPFRRVGTKAFMRLWAASGFWSLAILPSDRAPRTAVATESAVAVSVPANACDAALNEAVGDVRTRGADSADAVLDPLIARCPDSAGPLRELAGARFVQRRWKDAADYAARAVARDPNDEHALFLLGASLFMQDDPAGALRAWNRIGRPKLDLVRIEGLRHSRYQTIVEALALRPTEMLRADDFARARRRLDELPDRTSARIGVRPQEDGRVSVDVAIAEQSLPSGAFEWTAAALRAAIDREIAVDVPGFTGQGEAWSASWRWWDNRPRVAIGFAAPHVGRLAGVWRVDGSWEAETYALAGATLRREERTHAALSVSDWLSGQVRYAITTGFDAWSGRRAIAIGAALERWSLDDRLAVAGNATSWQPVHDDQDRGRFATLGASARLRSSATPREWMFEARAGTEHASDAAPLTLWSGAGEGRARPLLLRAHPLLRDGEIDLDGRSAFGRTVHYATGEAQRWFAKPALVHLGAAAFVDVARASRREFSEESITQADLGIGLRIRLPGIARILRVDAAHGLRDGNNAFTIGWTAGPQGR